METKDEVIRKLDKKIEIQDNMIRESICSINNAVDEINSSLNIINYLSYLKDDLIKNDGV